MSQYILHIGYSKTGTTAIQGFLACNRERLIKQGTLYPDIKTYGVWTHTQNHNLLGSALAGRLGWYGLTPEEYIQQFEKQRIKFQTKRTILSGESFLGGVQPWDYNEEQNYWDAVEQYIKKTGELFRKFDTKIILYLRRQDDWLESVINQTIKSGRLAPEKVRNASVDEMVKIYLPRLDYAKTLDIWAEVFGKEAIGVGVFDKKQLYKQDIVTDFCHRLEIDDSDLAKKYQNNVVENKKLSRDVLEFKRILNSIDRPKYQERVIAEALFDLSSNNYDKHFFNYSLLDEKNKKMLHEKFHHSNQMIGKEYLSLNDEELFKNNLENINSNDETYPGLSTEQAVLFLLSLERYLSLPKTKILIVRHWLAECLRNKSPLLHAIVRLPYYLFKK